MKSSMKSALIAVLTSALSVIVVLALLEGMRRRGLPDPVAKLTDVAFPNRRPASLDAPPAPVPTPPAVAAVAVPDAAS